MDQTKASALAREGFDLWMQGQLESAAEKYAMANQLADPEHWARHAYHGEYAGVLEKLGRIQEATEQAELALQTSVRQDGIESAIAQVECHLLAELLIRNARPGDAITVLKLVLTSSGGIRWTITYSAARAYAAMSEFKRAEEYAQLCLANIDNETKREEIAAEFRALLHSRSSA